MERLEKLKAKIFWPALLLLIPASWGLFVPGFYGASDDVHIAWLYELNKTIFSGQIPPRFVPDLSFGFGYPLFNFIFPMPFYLAEIFHLAGFNFVDSIKGLFFLSIPVSFLGMYFLLRQFSSRGLSLAGAILYVYAPYRAVDLYVRGALGEIVSFIFLPVILLSIIKLKKTKSLRWVGIGAIATSSLVLSHNITAYMFMVFIALFLLMQFLTAEKKGQFFARSFLLIFLALFSSIYFWLPAIVESSLMKYDTVFNFADHFPTILQLVTPYWGYGASVPGPNDGMSFFLGVSSIVVLLAGVIFSGLYWTNLKKGTKVLLVWIFICLILSFFLMNFRSSILWNNLPLLPYFQFPWRFLIMTTFLIPILIITLENFKYKNVFAVLIILLTLAVNGFYFRPQDFLGRKDEYFLNRYIPTPVASGEYMKIQEEYLRLPKNTKIRPDKNYPLVTLENGQIRNIYKLNELDAIVTVQSDTQSSLNYNKYNFPGWQAQIDRKKAVIETGDLFGQIKVNIPQGLHEVKISFEETIFKKVLDAISLATFLVSLGMIKNLWSQTEKLLGK